MTQEENKDYTCLNKWQLSIVCSALSRKIGLTEKGLHIAALFQDNDHDDVIGWAVRNVYENSGSAFSISFFDSPIHKHKYNDNAPERTWAECNDNIVPKMEIKAKKLVGKECLDPMKMRITIEQIEE